VRRVFLLAIPRKEQKGYNYASQKQVQAEAAEHLDIVQVDIFFETAIFNYTHDHISNVW